MDTRAQGHAGVSWGPGGVARAGRVPGQLTGVKSGAQMEQVSLRIQESGRAMLREPGSRASCGDRRSSGHVPEMGFDSGWDVPHISGIAWERGPTFGKCLEGASTKDEP